MQTVSVSTLKAFPALKNVPDEELSWLIENCEDYIVPDGQGITQPGLPLRGPHFIISGSIDVFMMQNGGQQHITTFRTGEVTGYLPYSRGKVANASTRAVGDTQLLSYPTERINEMIKEHFELTQALVHVMSNRVREFTSLQQQNEKMVALGKLSAGLAHELNNPASAIVRDSSSLLEHLRMQPKAFKKVIEIQMTSAQVDALNNEVFKLLDAKERPRLTLKEKTKLENELTDWLDDHNIENSYDIAETFADFGFGVDNLEKFCSHIPTAHCSPVFNWINSLLLTERMVSDIQESSRRISDLVGSVKTYTHMDRGGDKQYIDIHTGIGNTLTMLGYRMRKGNITLVEDFDKSLPPINALVSELNQVWTNLIDNALDAMEANGKGTLTVKTQRDREFVQVSVIDDGPGIPEDVKTKIFDPFFTTKEIGKGTGLGLEVVQRIVQQHRGSVKVNSEPGKTEFIICFPIAG